MIKIREAIVVEGRYDKAALAGLVDTVIVDTAGFGIFSDKEKLSLLRRLAQARGLVVLTDGDGGGFLIRNFLKGAIDPTQVKHAYIPDIYGKERRKKSPSKEGKLGVEGMKPDVLLQALRRAGVTIEGERCTAGDSPITKAELYSLGLTGRPDSAARRAYVLHRLELPERLTTNGMLDVLNVLVTRQELADILQEM
jgi:ribonuclease M5